MEVKASTDYFYDVPSSHWASKEVYYLSSLSIINGYEGPKGRFFAPNQTLTRGQAAKMVVAAKGEKPVGT